VAERGLERGLNEAGCIGEHLARHHAQSKSVGEFAGVRRAERSPEALPPARQALHAGFEVPPRPGRGRSDAPEAQFSGSVSTRETGRRALQRRPFQGNDGHARLCEPEESCAQQTPPGNAANRKVQEQILVTEDQRCSLNQLTPLDSVTVTPAGPADVAQGSYATHKGVRRQMHRKVQEQILVTEDQRGHRRYLDRTRARPKVLDRDADGRWHLFHAALTEDVMEEGIRSFEAASGRLSDGSWCRRSTSS
jgi:hypothetical protein